MKYIEIIIYRNLSSYLKCSFCFFVIFENMIFRKLFIAVAFVAGTSSGETVAATASIVEESSGTISRGATGGIRGSRNLLATFAALKADDPSQWTSLGCPTETANSGDSCTIPSGYEYMECTYGLRVCICQVQQPIFICQPYKPNQEWPMPTRPPVTPAKTPQPTTAPLTPPPTMASTPGPTMSSTPGPTTGMPIPPPITVPPTPQPITPLTPGPTLSPPITFPTPQPISPPTTSSPPNDGRPMFPPNGNPAVQNPDGLCVTNGIGASCRYATFPTIACCTADDTGQFFNACCVKDFEGISFGGVTDSGPLDPNEFDVIIGGRGADCKANYNDDGLTQGCAVYDTPGNMPTVSSQPAEYKPGVEGPCLKIEDGEKCDGTHTGTCTNDVFGTFKVCCPKCATGTYGLYSPGDSCQVTLPDPAACGYGDIVAAPVAPAPTGPTMGDGDDSSECENEFGTGVKVQVKGLKNPKTCVGLANKDRCNNELDDGSGRLVYEVCRSSCNKCTETPVVAPTLMPAGQTLPTGPTMGDDDDSSGGSGDDSSNSVGSSSGGAPEFTGQTTIQESGQECPTDPNEANGTNCCKFLPAAPGVAVEASCQYGSEYEFEACDCPGQLDTEGISYCQTVGWNCRTP